MEPLSNEELLRRIEHLENIRINGVRLKTLISMTIDADAWNIKRTTDDISNPRPWGQ